MGYVYAIEAGPGGFIKIGYAKNPEKRIAELAIANGSLLRLLAAVEAPESLEHKLHKYLSIYRLNGEWFYPMGEVLSVAMTMQCPESSDQEKVDCLINLPNTEINNHIYAKIWPNRRGRPRKWANDAERMAAKRAK